jgi:hypothetical protein
MTPAGASAQAAADSQLPAGWEFIEPGDWTLLIWDDELVVFMMAARQPMHIWLRVELKRAESIGTRSWNELIEVNCSAGQTRRLSVTFYSRSNLQSSLVSFNEVAPWKYPTPDTRGEIPLLMLCD